MKAIFIKALTNMRSAARLYRVEPPAVVGGGYNDEPVKTTDHIVVSAVIAPYTGPETYIFAADEHGNITDWGEMDGSQRGTLDHEDVLRAAGYEVA